MLNHLLPSVIHRDLNPGSQRIMKVSLATHVVSSYQHCDHISLGQLHSEVESHLMLSAVVCFVLFSFVD